MSRLTQTALSIGVAIAVTGVALAQTPPPPKNPASPPAPKAAPAKPPAPPPKPTGVAATVNGQPVSEAAVQRFLRSRPSDEREQLRPEVIDHLVELALLDQYLIASKVVVDPKEIDTKFAEWNKHVKELNQDAAQILANIWLTEAEFKAEMLAPELRWEKFLDAQAPEKVLKDYFEKNPEMFDGSMVAARHLLLSPGKDPAAKQAAVNELKQLKAKIESDVAAALAKLPANTDNLAREQQRCKLTDEAFAAAARDKSACPSKKEGGQLPFFPRGGGMVEPFAKAAFALKPFHISDPVETEFGYHLILVTARKPGQPAKFDDPNVKAAVREVYGSRLREGVIKQLRAQAKVAVTPRAAPPARQ